ncbi:uncharacterized protein LOC143200792 [Rhynchophorus ferrugineus]|uniref:uncharacterized protein LOC143200792 n=1 Tax=Rhynchophorus ferrugineus TaxID=354439 RepID=UPI003FCC6A00
MRWLALIIVRYGLNIVYSCHWLQNVNVTAVTSDGIGFMRLINGCIEDTLFAERPVRMLLISHQENVRYLGRNTIKHMGVLEALSFWKCPISTITPNIAGEAPNLKTFEISYGSLKKIPRGAFNNLPLLELLSIHNNKINLVEDLSFANLPHLKRIYASHNDIENWSRDWFTNTTQLMLLDFRFNKIRTIPRRAFGRLSKLREIYLDYNAISVIHSSAFRGVHKLIYLGLRHNRLKEIPGDVFPDDFRIHTLMLDANILNFLSSEVLEKLIVKSVSIDNNPWKCPCLDRIWKWVYKNNGSIKTNKDCVDERIPVCAYSTESPQSCLENVDQKLTKRYYNALKSLHPPLAGHCKIQRFFNEDQL